MAALLLHSMSMLYRFLPSVLKIRVAFCCSWRLGYKCILSVFAICYLQG